MTDNSFFDKNVNGNPGFSPELNGFTDPQINADDVKIVADNTAFHKAKTRKRQPDSVFKDSCRAPGAAAVEEPKVRRKAERKGWKRHPWLLDSIFKNLSKASLHGAARKEFSRSAKKLFPGCQDFAPAVFATVLIHCDANKNGMYVNGPSGWDLESYKELRVIKQSLAMMGIRPGRDMPSDEMLRQIIEYVDGINGELLASHGLGRLVGEIISLEYGDRKRLRLDNLKAAGMTDKAHEAKRAEEAATRARAYRRGKGRPSKNDVVTTNMAKADALHALWNPDSDQIGDAAIRKRRRDGEAASCKNWRVYQSYLAGEATKAKRAKAKEADKRAERAPLPRSEGTKVELAWWFLEGLLGAGWVEQEAVKTDTGEAGHKWRTVRRAADMGGVARIPMREGHKIAAWYWSLLEHAKADPRQMLNLLDVQGPWAGQKLGVQKLGVQVTSYAPRTHHQMNADNQDKESSVRSPEIFAESVLPSSDQRAAGVVASITDAVQVIDTPTTKAEAVIEVAGWPVDDMTTEPTNEIVPEGKEGRETKVVQDIDESLNDDIIVPCFTDLPGVFVEAHAPTDATWFRASLDLVIPDEEAVDNAIEDAKPKARKPKIDESGWYEEVYLKL